MNVIQKSLLDLIPLTVVAVVIALISANTVRDVSQTYDNIISVEAEVLVNLRDAQNAILQWNADVKEGASLVRNNGDKAKEKFQSATFTIDEYLFNQKVERRKARFEHGDVGRLSSDLLVFCAAPQLCKLFPDVFDVEQNILDIQNIKVDLV